MIRVGIDLGNSKISIIVCDESNDGNRKILSFISKPTNFIRKSLITNIPEIKKEINQIINEAATESETQILSVNLNIPVIDSLSDYVQSKVDLPNEKISELHIKKAINQSNLLEDIKNYIIIHKSIIDYQIDKDSFVNDPRGMFGSFLKVNFYKFAIKENFIKTVTSIFNDLNIHIENFIPSSLSSALATLNSDDRELGTICIDLGSASTSIAVFKNDKLIFVDAIKVGGDHITNDLARKFSTSIESAERLKTLYGSVNTTPSDEFEIIEIPIISSEAAQFKQINRSVVNSIIKPRVEETIELVWQKLKEFNIHKKQIRNVVLTGGGSLLEGIEGYAQIIFDSNVRIGKPLILKGLNNKYYKPQYSQTVGTIMYKKPEFSIDYLEKAKKSSKNSLFSKISAWLDQYI